MGQMHIGQGKTSEINDLCRALHNQSTREMAERRRSRERQTTPACRAMRATGKRNTIIIAAQNFRQDINWFLCFLHQNDVRVFRTNHGQNVFQRCAVPAKKVPAQNTKR